MQLYRERLQRAARLGPALRRVATTAELRLQHAVRSLRRLPAKIASGGHRRLLISRQQQLRQLMTARTNRVGARIDGASRALDHLGPTRVLERGYSITTLEGSAKPLRDASSVHGGQTLTTRLANGQIRSLVSSTATGKSRTDNPAAQPSLFEDASHSGDTPDDRSD
jgi:exodeoxyribonuclease VII large subunit